MSLFDVRFLTEVGIGKFSNVNFYRSTTKHASRALLFIDNTLMSRIERKYCLLSTSSLVGLFDIFILLHIWQNCVCFGDFLPMRTLCDAYHKEFESH